MFVAFVTVLVICATMWVVAHILYGAFRLRLRRTAPQLDIELPSIWLSPADLRIPRFMMRFIIKMEYQSIQDPGFVKFCDRYRVFILCWYAVVLITIVFILLYIGVRPRGG